GLMQDGVAGAKQALYRFWRSISDAGDSVFNPYRYAADWPLLSSFVSIWVDVLSHIWSPYDNPFYSNKLERLLLDAIDFGRLRRCKNPQLFVCATNVKTSERKIFRSIDL